MREKEEAIRNYYEYVDHGEVEKLLSLFTEDVEYSRPGTDKIEGKEALRRFYEHERIIEEGTHRILKVIVSGTIAASQGTFDGALKSGDSLSIGFAEFFEFRDGQIFRRWTYTDQGRV